jgi:hypothetical protein
MQEVVDFGEVYDGAVIRRRLAVENSAPYPVSIVRFVTPCNCSSLTDRLPLEVPPRATRDLSFQFDAARRVGPFQKEILIETEEDGTNRAYRVGVRVLIKPAVEFGPQELDFGALRRDESKSLTVTVAVLKPVEIPKPVALVRLPQRFAATLEECPPAKGVFRQWRIQCSVKGADLLEDPLDEDLLLATPSTVNVPVKIPVRASKLTLVAAQPIVVKFGVLRSGEEAVREVELSGRDGGRFRVVSAAVSDQLPSLALTLQPLQSGWVRNASLQVNALYSGQNAGFFETALRVVYQTEAHEEQFIRIPIRGYYLSAGI